MNAADAVEIIRGARAMAGSLPLGDFLTHDAADRVFQAAEVLAATPDPTVMRLVRSIRAEDARLTALMERDASAAAATRYDVREMCVRLGYAVALGGRR